MHQIFYVFRIEHVEKHHVVAASHVSESEPQHPSDFDKAEIIFNILLNNPEDFELPIKPSAERKHNFMCTLDMNKISVASTRADDNGAYGKRGNTSKMFYVTGDTCQQAHKNHDNLYYINKRDIAAATSRPVYIKKFVDPNKVCTVNRTIFFTMIAIIKCVKATQPHPYYMYLSRWHDHGSNKEIEDKEFVVERHGNAKKPHAAAYYRRDESVFNEVRQRLESGTSPDEVYVQMNKRNDRVTSVDETISNPRLVHNQKQIMKPSTGGNNSHDSEAEALISLIHGGDSFVQSVRFDNDSYSSVNYLPHIINDIKIFCVNGNSPLVVVDTTFKVADHLWYTDSSYENESLIAEAGKRPHFPGPTSQWQFRRNQQSFRRLIGELLIADSQLQQIKKIGHDLDVATSKGLKDLPWTCVAGKAKVNSIRQELVTGIQDRINECFQNVLHDEHISSFKLFATNEWSTGDDTDMIIQRDSALLNSLYELNTFDEAQL